MGEKLRKLWRMDEPNTDFKTYILFRINEYDSEQDMFKSFDDYIDYCITMGEEA